ncbi:KAP family P-loop NTPase fold protein [Pseudoalteromonas maricaloris]|uniref:KAP family P-loop NTPase fold protein n=1 Tax=Pseudoalteromonas maricaloris TaxID=184924 RepID=UPI00057DB51D|nr:P-loop NTPase fold protein [Pseudoalteromonas flavipulchra]KID37180.1 NTPase KAP [Pseudoalteromonas flavipulchra NCIMB 2033 = ATCC BAA-314]MBD0782993.1 NTPase KAP [Pseudoalteromonas flavipulchra]MBE0374752.1 hypothetical protein [Pseudoalteromonas flavipulchra NCIMB 2033 = ATCC BAA-314]
MQIKTNEIAVELDNPFQFDLLDRQSEIETISSITTSVCAPLVMSIDSPWGTGKTTFIKMWQAYLEAQNVTAIYFNAWESDYAEDPLVALVAQLDRWVKGFNNDDPKCMAWKKAKSLLPSIAKSTVVNAAKIATFGSLDLEKEVEKVAADFVGESVTDLVDTFNEQASAINQFKELVGKTISALGDEQKNLLIFVDELDRCRPTYSIELLERIKHLFNIERIVFVLSTDIEQLSHSICAVYGNQFNARNYLQRFIDINYSLKTPDNRRYIDSLFRSLSIEDYFDNRDGGQLEKERLADCCEIFATRFSLSLRAINLLFTRVKLILHSVPTNYYLYGPLLISLVVLREHNIDLYTRYVKDPSVADEVISYLSEGLSNEMLTSFPLALVSAYLIVPNWDSSRDSRFKQLIEPYEKRLENKTYEYDELYQSADHTLRCISSLKNSESHVNLKTTMERVELFYRVNIS